MEHSCRSCYYPECSHYNTKDERFLIRKILSLYLGTQHSSVLYCERNHVLCVFTAQFFQFGLEWVGTLFLIYWASFLFRMTSSTGTVRKMRRMESHLSCCQYNSARKWFTGRDSGGCDCCTKSQWTSCMKDHHSYSLGAFFNRLSACSTNHSSLIPSHRFTPEPRPTKFSAAAGEGKGQQRHDESRIRFEPVQNYSIVLICWCISTARHKASLICFQHIVQCNTVKSVGARSSKPAGRRIIECN